MHAHTARPWQQEASRGQSPAEIQKYYKKYELDA